MAAPLADLKAVADRLVGGVVPSESEAFVLTLLDGASDLVRAEYGDIDDRIEAGNPAADAVARVVAAMVKRAYLAPGDGMVESETAGPFGVRYRPADLYLRESERLILGGAGALGASGARSVRMGY